MSQIEKLVIATRNPGKIEFYRQVFKDLVKEVIGLSDLNITGTPEEIGDTAEENARQKATFYSNKTDLPIFCEDEALYVDFLDQDHQPGTHVRRLNRKDDATDEELINYWQNQIKDLSPEERTGFWHFAYALSINGDIKIATHDRPVRFYYPPSDNRVPGWPLSSLQGSTDFNKPHSELTIEEKAETAQKTIPIILEIYKELINS